MKFTRYYIFSMILSVILTLAALITLLPVFGIIQTALYPPVSTVALLGLVWINCMIRAEMKRKQFGG